MSELTTSKVIALITAQCRKIVRQQSSGISDVKWDTATHSLIFTLTNGKTVSVPITASASGITYSNKTSKLDANDVQSAIDEILTKLNKSISDLGLSVAYLDEQNDFTAPNNFNAETNFSADVSVTNSDVDIHNGMLDITDNTDGKDIVTRYNAEKITINENNENTTHTLTFPKETGTFVTTNKFDTKHSVVKNRDTDTQKEDTWFTDDADATLAMTQENTTTNSSVSVQKGYAEISTFDFGELTNNSRVSVTSDLISLVSADANTPDAKTTTLTISPENVQINGKDISTETELEKKLDKVETPSSFMKLYGIQKDGSQTLVNIDEQTDSNSTNLVQNKVVTNALKDKLNVFAPGESNRVYVRKENNLDSSLPYTYTAEGDSIVYRNAYGRTQVEDPTQSKDAVNKQYADNLQKYLSITGESGILDEEQYNLVKTYDNLIIQRTGIDYRRSGYPTNGSGDYVFVSDYYSKPNGTEEWAAYIITIKTDKSWTFTIKPFFKVDEQSYPPFVTIDPASAVNGTFTEEELGILQSSVSAYIMRDGEIYNRQDDKEDKGYLRYVHDGEDNLHHSSTKDIAVTLSTRAWTLRVQGTDIIPTINSNNLITSGGVYTALSDKTKTDGSNINYDEFAAALKVEQFFRRTPTSGVNVIKFGNIWMVSKTVEVAGNAEEEFAFPIQFDNDYPMCWCNSSAEGQSVNNSSAVISFDSLSMKIRTCGANSTVTMFAIGWKSS